MLFTLIGFGAKGYAFEFRVGDYYFDNSKIHFDLVKFAVFDTVSNTVRVYDMSLVNNEDWWQFTLDKPISVDLYSFIESDVPQGDYYCASRQFIDSLTTRNTQLVTKNKMTAVINYPDYVYCPIMDSDESDGYWRTQDSYNATPSGTLPIIYINTRGSEPIVTKDKYIKGGLWLDNCGIEEYESIGSQEEPQPIQIKGRGNYTWRGFYKKPYKIKFSKKQSPLGLDNSKHFILMAHADDHSGYLRDETGFELSRQLGMEYTPRQVPVEVVLNGDYIGLYFLCEKIRVEVGRVNITEQEDNDTNPYNATGGWLLELNGDGVRVFGQHENNDKLKPWYCFTTHSPEEVSKVQKKYISRFLGETDSCVFVPNKTDAGWEKYLDTYSLSRFYVLNEVMANIESFCRSMYLYKDWGEDEKLHFGPVWDFGNSFYLAGTDDFIYNYQTQFYALWIKDLLQFPHLYSAVLDVWRFFNDNNILDKVMENNSALMTKIAQAKIHDKVRWPHYSDQQPDASTLYLNEIRQKVAWLNEQWSTTIGDVNQDKSVNSADITAIYNYILNSDDAFLKSSDVNGDGAINAADITAIYNLILGQ